MQGILIYNKVDYNKNESFAKWIISEFLKYDIIVKLVIYENINKFNFKNIDFAINRTRNYNLSLLLEINNIKVYNNSIITLLGNNKIAGYNYAKELGYNFSKIYINYENFINTTLENEKIIVKPIYGHGAEGIYLFNKNEEEFFINDNIYQKFNKKILGDVRFYILKNDIEIAILRYNNNHICSNYSLGGNFKIYDYNQEEKNYILNFIKNLDIDFAGIDFLLLKNKKLLFNEIEDVVGTRMLSVLGINNMVNKFVYNVINDFRK